MRRSNWNGPTNLAAWNTTDHHPNGSKTGIPVVGQIEQGHLAAYVGQGSHPTIQNANGHRRLADLGDEERALVPPRQYCHLEGHREIRVPEARRDEAIPSKQHSTRTSPPYPNLEPGGPPIISFPIPLIWAGEVVLVLLGGVVMGRYGRAKRTGDQ